MPLPSTHLDFISQILSSDPNLFLRVSMDPVYFGAVFPDIDYMSATRIKSNKFDLHQMNDLDEKSNKKRENIEFGKKLVENARTREEKAFALGYLSHLIVDRRVHETLDAIEISPIDQFIIECYLTTQHRFNKSIFIQKFPAKLFERTLNNSVSNYNHVNYSALKIKDFSFKNYLLNAYIREKFNPTVISFLPLAETYIKIAENHLISCLGKKLPETKKIITKKIQFMHLHQYDEILEKINQSLYLAKQEYHQSSLPMNRPLPKEQVN